MTELAVIHVYGAFPGDLLRIDAESIALLYVVVQHGSQKVVGSADGMEVAGEVEVDVLHGDDLGIAAACRAALDAEDRAERRLTQCDDSVLANFAQTVGETDGGGCFSFAGRRRSNCSDENEFALFRELFQCVEIQLGLIPAVVFNSVVGNAEGCRNAVDGLKTCFLGDFDIGFEWHDRPPEKIII